MTCPHCQSNLDDGICQNASCHYIADPGREHYKSGGSLWALAGVLIVVALVMCVMSINAAVTAT